MVVEAKLKNSSEILADSTNGAKEEDHVNGNDGGESSGGEEIANVHRLVQDENAKTILLNVPLEDDPPPGTPSKSGSAQGSNYVASKPPRRPAASPRPTSSHHISNAGEATRRKLSSKSLPTTSSARVRSASVGRDKHSDTQARYWAFLFENLRRAVDDLYRTCESDESIPAVKEVILVFENYVRDFRNLANWLKLNREYENTPPPQRPTSLAWEVRKTPPASSPAFAKLTPTSALVAQRLFMATPAKRALDFEDKKDGEIKKSVSEVIKEVDVTPVDEKENVAPVKDDVTVIVNVNASPAKQEPEKSAVEDLAESKVEPSVHVKTSPPLKETKPAKPTNEPKPSTDTQLVDPKTTDSKQAVDQKPEQDKPDHPTGSPKSSTSPKSSKSSASTCSSSTSAKSAAKEPTPGTQTMAAHVRQTTAKAARPNTAPNNVVPKATAPTARLTWSATASKNVKVAPSTSLAKAKSNSSSNLYNGNAVSSKSNKVWSEQSARNSDLRQNRVSLIARQTRPNTAATSNGPARTNLMVRSATSATLSSRGGRVVAFGRGVIMNNTPARGGSCSQPRVEVNQRHSGSAPQATSSAGHGQNNSSGNQNHQTIPFGSTSSISSSSSNRSWADTVRGIPMAPRSVEDLSQVKAVITQMEDEGGWETVRPRTRSKFSPSNSVRQNKSDHHSKDRHGGSMRVRHTPRSRFQVPSSAMSLPSIALFSTDCDDNESKVQDDFAKDKHRALKPVKSASGLLRRDRPNLERISGSDSGSSESSAENLHQASPKLKRPTPGKSKDGVSKKSLSPRKEIKSPAKSPSPPPSQDDDGCESSDVMDSEIAKRDVAIALAEEEERCLAREIQEMEKSEMPDVDTDGDQASAGDDSEIDRKSPPLSGQVTPPNPSYATLFEGLSWADEIDLEEQLQESRYPGRAIQIHEKLSSPARKREPHETFKHHQEKQKNARIRREKFQEEKAQKLLTLNARIQEVIAQKMFLMSEKRDMINSKMARAEVKRQEHIDGIRKKAREEDAKLKEIAFINELQAQNARIDAMAQNQTSEVKVEERLAELAEERHKKQEQREAKEARAEERRKAMEEKRLKDMEALKERIRSREERIQEEQELARKERQEAAREKARDREEKLSTVRAAERDMKEELHEKIIQKHQEAARRHQEKLEHIRQKAFELSVQRCDDEAVPKLKPYNPKKKCSLCSVLINNEVHLQSHLRGRTHAEKISQVNEGRKLTREELQLCNIKYILDAPADERDPKIVESKERLKAMKKKAKKLKTRMLARAVNYESNLSVANSAKCDAPNRAKIGKSLRDIEKVFSSQGKGAWPNNAISALERALGELLRTFEKNIPQDKSAFYALDGFGIMSKLFNLLAEQRQSCVVPLKSIALCCRAWTLACSSHRPNTEFVLKNNHLTTLVDILLDRLQILMPDSLMDELGVPPPQEPQVDPVAKAIMSLLAQALEDLCLHLRDEGKSVEQSKPADISVRAQDQVSYIVAVGIVDKLAAYFHSVHDPIEGEPEVGEFLLAALQLVSALTGVVEALTDSPTDPTHLWTAFQVTDLAGTVSMLYGMLLHQGGSDRDVEAPKLPEHTMMVACASLHLLHRMVRQRLTMVQEVLGQECISLEFRHIASYLLWYCQSHNVTDLLHLTIVLVGYFAAKNSDNQVIVQSGQQPSVLQQLCNLPFVYFSQPDLKRILFPTLLACCHNNEENTGILTEEMNWQLIEDFLKGPDGKQHLVELVLSN